MKQRLLFSLIIFPLFVFPQTRIDISPSLANDSSQMLAWYMNGKQIGCMDFPIYVSGTRNRLDTIVLAQSNSDEIKYDTIFVLFSKNSDLLLVPDNDGSFDIIQKHPGRRYKNKAKFVVWNTASDTIICCYSSETALVGQIFTKSGSSGWLKPFTTPYNNMIYVCIFNAKDLIYYVLEEQDALLFGDKKCAIIGWDANQLSHLSKIVSYKLRFFKRKRIIIKFDNDTNQFDLM